MYLSVLSLLAPISLFFSTAQANSAFAHFMVGNTAGYNTGNWRDDITAAQIAHIDAFALNIANGDPLIDIQLPIAFDTADSMGFKLFFSFDYAGGGAFEQSRVLGLLQTYQNRASYFHRGSQPLASTFEGPSNAADWASIKSLTGAFFVPSWSSDGAKKALTRGNADGLFNWGAWPNGPTDNLNTIDASYRYYLGESGLTTYMMPVSPWFYTNMPCFGKNWLWRGDDLWYDRWQQVWSEQPEYVEIISWNDYGESHYIGPLAPYDAGYDAFGLGHSPYNYAANMPHDGWRAFLPFIIDTYKYGSATISQEGVQAWYRLNPGSACGTGGTTGNTIYQSQTEYAPTEIAQDKVFFTALLASYADVSVTIGNVNVGASWENQPDGGAGLYHGSVSFGGHTGNVVVTISRGGGVVAQMNGNAITTDCSANGGLSNFNAWVGSAMGGGVSATPLSLSNQVCIAGTGAGNIEGLCSYSCARNYCPWQACTCTQMGAAAIKPVYVVPTVYGCPLPSLDPTYLGICAFACGTDYCPIGACQGSLSETTCATTPLVDPPPPGSAPTPSIPADCPQFDSGGGSDAVCNSGAIPADGDQELKGLCDFSCNHGHCPAPCVCATYGTPVVTDPDTTVGCPGTSYVGDAAFTDLCAFTCSRNYCPTGACVASTTGTCGSDMGQIFFQKPPADTCKKIWDYDCIECGDFHVVTSPFSNPDEYGDDLWAYAGAQNFLKYTLAQYNYYVEQGQTHSPLEQWIPYQFGGNTMPTTWQCNAAADTASCNDNSINCDNRKDMDWPQVGLLLSSWANLHSYYVNQDTAIKDTAAAIEGGISGFQKTFSPEESSTNAELETFKKVFEVFDMVFSFTSLKAWEKIFSPSLFEKYTKVVDKVDSIKSDFSTVFDASEAIAEAQQPDLLGEIGAINAISTAITSLVDALRLGTSTYLDNLFRTYDGQAEMVKLLEDGKWLKVKTISTYDLSKEITGVILSRLIPISWTISLRNHPVIIVMDESETLPTSVFVTNVGVRTLSKEAEGEAALRNFDGKNLYLMDAHDCDGPTLRACSAPILYPLNGATELVGNLDKWGGLKWEDMIVSSYRGYVANGNKNGVNSIVYNDLAKEGQSYNATGVYNFPVCDYTTMVAGWAGAFSPNLGNTDERCEFYPCC